MLNVEIEDCDKVINAKIEDGVKGDRGPSNYEVAVANGFNGTLDEWLESLVGPPVPVAQELGDDPDLAVSQKLLKDSIDSMEQSNSEAVAEAERLNNLSQQAASSAAESELNASASAESANSSALSAGQSASESEASAEQSLQSSNSSESSAQSASESASSAGVSAEQASLAAVAADDSASKAKQSELSAIGSAERSEAGANSASSSATQAEQSAQSAASNAQSATDSADLAAASALAAKASEDSAKGSAEQAESSAKRADAVAEIVEDKFDKSKVVGELGDRDDLVINQARVTLELNTLYRQIELLTAWSGHEIPKQPLYADFIGQRYAKDGKPCRFEDIFEFTRLSKAWRFEGGKLEEYGVNEPRFSGKGLLIEPESTNLVKHSTDLVKSLHLNNNNFEISYIDTIVGVKGAEVKNKIAWVCVTSFVPASDVVTIHYCADLLSIGDNLVKDADTQTLAVRDNINKKIIRYADYSRLENKSCDYYSNINGLPEVGVTQDVITGNGHYFYYTTTHSGPNNKFKLFYSQTENGSRKTTLIKTNDAPATRLPETLTVLTESNFIIEADEGIQVNGNEITGFGYIRKLEVK